MIRYQGSVGQDYGDEGWDDIYIFSVNETSQSVIAVVSDPLFGEVPDDSLNDVVILRVYPKPSLEFWVSDFPAIYQEVIYVDSLYAESAEEEAEHWKSTVMAALEEDLDFQKAIKEIQEESE